MRKLQRGLPRCRALSQALSRALLQGRVHLCVDPTQQVLFPTSQIKAKASAVREQHAGLQAARSVPSVGVEDIVFSCWPPRLRLFHGQNGQSSERKLGARFGQS
ncbi:hypothetical protein TREES_T100020936 [Tupaia chinensis]|uniref:Uncharacterized protein n=1 Tax=Tupaia chinensis TaxID=246437 RepID=L9JE71_TUPCH|nr:hypothetical protein TREES_T100020936 [Tupaia chinensis]